MVYYKHVCRKTVNKLRFSHTIYNKYREINYKKLTPLSVYLKTMYKKIHTTSVLNKYTSDKEYKITKSKDNLYDAMRNSIYLWIISNSGYDQENFICNSCGDINNIELDHHELHFIEVYYNFINSQTSKPSSFNDGKIFKNKDKNFEKKWIEYYKDNCQLRFRCKTCNWRYNIKIFASQDI